MRTSRHSLSSLIICAGVFFFAVPANNSLLAQVSAAGEVEERLIGADATALGLMPATTNIVQQGQSNLVNIQQVDLQQIQILQSGSTNELDLQVSGPDNTTVLSQQGAGNDIDLDYDGRNNLIQLSQNGNNNTADLEMGYIEGQQLTVEQLNEGNTIEHDANVDGTLGVPLRIVQEGNSNLRRNSKQ